MLNLPLISIRRPVFALMLNVALVALGLVSLNRLNVDLNPDVEVPFLTVTTVLEGASPETVETEVTDILEEQINTIEGIRDLSSVSSEGVSQVFVEFETSYDVDIKAQQVREKVAPVRADLPLDAEDPVVTQLDPDATPILSVMLGGPVSVRELSEIAENMVKDRLERLPGVGSIEIIGSRRREVRIWLDPVRLAGYGLSIDDVRSALLLENAETAGGRVEGREREWTVTTSGRVKRVEDFGALIAAERGGRLVYLRDVAKIEDGLAEERSLARFNGQRGVSLELRRRSGANTVSVAEAVRAEVEALRPNLAPGTQVLITRDMAVFIEDSIYSVFSNMFWGGLLVVAVVLLFLRNPRSTLISALAIPSSVIASFTFFYLAGFTLNVMTLMALSLAVGVVIDDAIVVLEVIYRRIEQGLGRREAAEEGASQVTLAVISTTLALCAVFVPIAFLTGTVGQWFYEFGMVMAIAVCVSSVFALTLTPMLGSRVLTASQGRDPVSRGLGRALDGLDRFYQTVLRRALAHRLITLIVAVAAMSGGVLVARTLPFNLFVAEDRSEFNVDLKMPIGTPLAVTSEAARRVDQVLEADPEVRNRFATIGGGSRKEPHRASIYVQLTNKRERDLSQAAIMDRVRGQLLVRVPQAEEIAVSPINWIAGSDDQLGARAVTYSLRGPSMEELEFYSERLVRLMRSDPAFVDVGTSWETGKPEIEIDVDRDRAADLGVQATVIGRTIRTLLAGEELGSFEEGGERYDVRVQVLPEYRGHSGEAGPDPDPHRLRSTDPDHQRRRHPARRRRGPDQPAEPRPGNHDCGERRGGNSAVRTGRPGRGVRPADRPRGAERARAQRHDRRHAGDGLLAALRFRAGHRRHLHGAGVTLQLPRPPGHDHDVGAPLLHHRRLPGPEALGQAARHDERHRPAGTDGAGDEERHPADRLHQPAPPGRALAPGGHSRGRAGAPAAGADDCAFPDLRPAPGCVLHRFRLGGPSGDRGADDGRHGHLHPAHPARRARDLRPRGPRGREGNRLEPRLVGVARESRPATRRFACPRHPAAATSAPAEATAPLGPGGRRRRRMHRRAAERNGPAGSEQRRNEEVRSCHAGVVIGIHRVDRGAGNLRCHQRLVLGWNVPVLLRQNHGGGHVDLTEPRHRVEPAERRGGLDHGDRIGRSDLLLHGLLKNGILNVREHSFAHAGP